MSKPLLSEKKLSAVLASFLDAARQAGTSQVGKAPQSSQGYLRLHANENPFPLPEPVMKTALNMLERLFHYPEDDSATLREIAAKAYGLDKSQAIAANGSAEILSLIHRSFLSPGDKAGMLAPGFGYNHKLAALQGAKLEDFELKEDYSFPLEEMTSSHANEMKFLIIANPNNPTGTFVPIPVIEEVLKKVDRLVVVDEAYGEFGPDSAMRLVDTYPNLLVLKSFSKSFAVAGARVGFGFGHPAVIQNLMGSLSMFNMNILGQAVGISIVQNLDAFKPLHEAIKAQRSRVSGELKGLGFDVVPSHTNFVLARVPEGTGSVEWQSALKDKKILVSGFPSGRLKDFLRITITTKEQMDTLIEALHGVHSGFAPERGAFTNRQSGGPKTVSRNQL